MLDFLLNLLPRIQSHSRKLDEIESFIDKPWIMIEDNGNEKLVFRRNSELLMIKHGTVKLGKWEYIEPLDSLLIDRGVDKLLLKYAFINKGVMLLKIESVHGHNIIPFVNELEVPTLDYESYLMQLSQTGISPAIDRSLDMKIGDELGGGILFHIDKQNKIGLIASKYDLQTTGWYNEWYNRSLVTGANNMSDGCLNTQQILSVFSNKTKYAAKSCSEYRGGGFDDWFLPAIDQLQILRDSRNTNNLKNIVAGGKYWSSTEYDGLSAYGSGLENMSSSSRMGKNNIQPVKAIREIKLL